MRSVRIPAPVRDRLGHDGATGLLDMFDSARAEWKDEIMTAAIDRFERRITEEVAGLRVTLVRELHESRVEIVKWSFVFWIGQIAALAGFCTLLFRAAGR